MGSLLNFRCPDDLWASIEKLGKDRHPGGTHHRSQRDYDLTSTMLDIVRAGISALEDDPSLLNKTDGKTINKTEVQEMINQAIASNKTENKTIDKTEIESMVQTLISNKLQDSIKIVKDATAMESSVFATKKDLMDLEETILNLIEEKQTVTNKGEVDSLTPSTPQTLSLSESLQTNGQKSYEDSVNYIIELNRTKISQTKIAKLLNDGGYPTKGGEGNWVQSMVSGVIKSRTVSFTIKD
jgi:hypothetical protein